VAEIIITSDSSGGAIRVEVFPSPSFPKSLIQPAIVPAGAADFGGGPGATFDLGGSAVLDLVNRSRAEQQILSSTWLSTQQQQLLLQQINAAGPGSIIYFVPTNTPPQTVFPPALPPHRDPFLFPKVPGLL